MCVMVSKNLHSSWKILNLVNFIRHIYNVKEYQITRKCKKGNARVQFTQPAWLYIREISVNKSTTMGIITAKIEIFSI